MKRFILISTSFFTLLGSLSLSAQPITHKDDSLVKQLEGRYVRFVVAAHKGDMATFRSLRTVEANQSIPPDATSAQLKDMADIMAPSLSGYQFVQLETQGKEARMTYKKRSKEGLMFLVQMFEKDASGWKIGNNLNQDFIGHTPNETKGLKQALSSPVVRFSGK